MDRHLDQELDNIRRKLIHMGSLVEKMVGDSMKALFERDEALAKAVIKRDSTIDAFEMEIDEGSHTVLATQQPTASDMRFLVAVMKINNNLERVGDSAVNICQSVEQLNREPQLKPYIDLQRLDDLVREMLDKSLESFVGEDGELALRVCRADDKVDALYRQLFRELLTLMIEDPKTVSHALHLLLIARNLERVADHATNIAEDVIYHVEGRDIRHLAADES
jgi:phosphate transport system protein